MISDLLSITHIQDSIFDKLHSKKGSVGCRTDLTLLCHPGFILSIEIHSQNTKTEDEAELNISEIYITSFLQK
jgi:hypothetical protein